MVGTAWLAENGCERPQQYAYHFEILYVTNYDEVDNKNTLAGS